MATTIGDIEVNEHAAERFLLRFCDDFGPYPKGKIKQAQETLTQIFRLSKKSKFVRPIPYVDTVVYEGCHPETKEPVWMMVDRGKLYTVMTDEGFVGRYVKKGDKRVFVGNGNLVRLDKPARSNIDVRCGKRRRA